MIFLKTRRFCCNTYSPNQLLNVITWGRGQDGGELRCIAESSARPISEFPGAPAPLRHPQHPPLREHTERTLKQRSWAPGEGLRRSCEQRPCSTRDLHGYAGDRWRTQPRRRLGQARAIDDPAIPHEYRSTRTSPGLWRLAPRSDRASIGFETGRT